MNFSFFTLYSLLLLSFFLYLKSVPIYVIVHVHTVYVESHLRQLVFLRNSENIYIYCLVVCLTLLASFFLPSSLIKTCSKYYDAYSVFECSVDPFHVICFCSIPGPGIKPVEERNIEYLEEVAVGIAK